MTLPKQTQSPYIVLVAIDYSELSALALKESFRHAAAHDSAQVHVVHALPGFGPVTHGLGTPDLAGAAAGSPPDTDPSAMVRDMQAYVEKVMTEHRLTSDSASANAPTWTMHFRMSDATSAIVQLAADLQADVVVVGTHGRTGISRLLLGSVAEAVVRRAPCPVLVVRPVGTSAESDVPQIEPPCPECLQARQASGGQELWCERHRAHHDRAHTYHFTPFRGSHQSGLLLHPLK